MDDAAFWRLAQLIWRAFLAFLAAQADWMEMIILTRTNKPDQTIIRTLSRLKQTAFAVEEC